MCFGCSGWLCETSDFVPSFVASIAVRENDRRLSPSVCWLIYCSPTHRWEINVKPSVRSQYNKWPIQTSTYSSPEGSPYSLPQAPMLSSEKHVQVQPHRVHTFMHAKLQTPCDNVGKAAGHGVFRWVETTLKTAHGLEERIVAFPWELHKETRRPINSFGTLNLNAHLEFSEMRILEENIKKMENISAEVVLPITYYGDFTRQFTSQLSLKKKHVLKC